MRRNARSVITSARVGETVVTVAVRGSFVISEISPKKSPSESVRSFFFAARDLRGAVDDHEELAARRALPGELLAFLEIELVGDLPDCLELRARAARKERHLLQELLLRVLP